ncbi:hypothetical protein Javan116_0017 [Streptococcus phage Javan116]|nr:hypothetical protein Javan116_0017 [Streptococcus phage Javan116]
MKVIRTPEKLDAFEWTGSTETYKKMKELSSDCKDKLYMRDGQLVVYDYMFEEEQNVEFGDFIVFEDDRIEICKPFIFDILYEEVSND